jgi:hypothetical protein
MIQGNFVDSYYNMTYKHTMAFKWFVYNCPDVNYLLKTDDDVFVNTPALYKTLETFSNQTETSTPGNLIVCTEVVNPRPKRSYRSKWRISYEEYPEKFFPNYCSGFSIFYTADVVTKLYNLTQNLPYFWIDDVHITGIVRKKLNISITSRSSVFLDEKQTKKIIEGSDAVRNQEFLFAEPDLNEKNIKKLWKNINL